MKILVILFACISAVAADQTTAQSAAPVDDSQISGIVVDHMTNRPLNHVLVQITKVGKGGGNAWTLTEADGHFTFLHVPKGKYHLQAQKRGQVAQGFHSTGGGFATAIVVDGHLKTDELIFPLRTDSSINGIVMGEDGEPVRNAQVHLFHEAINNGEAQTTQGGMSATNSSGQFHFGHLSPGKYYVAAWGTPWYSQQAFGQPGESVYPVTFYGDMTDARTARAITLTEGSAATVQILLRLVPGIHVKIQNNLQGLTLSVPGPGGTQIQVPTAITSSGARGQGFNRQMQAPVLTPAGVGDDNLELFNVAAGRYEVTFQHNGGQEQSVQTVDLSNGSILSPDSLPAPAMVSGRIAFDSPRPDGELGVFLNGNRRGTMASVAADGAFKFEKISEGEFNVNLNSPSLVITSMEAKGARVVNDHLELQAGASVELTIHAQSSETLVTIEGFAVQGSTGAAGVMVLLLPQDLARMGLTRRDQSDADGSFSLANVRPGRYTLLAIDDGQDLAYKDEKVIKPYLDGGLTITIPLKSNDPLKVPIQTRKP